MEFNFNSTFTPFLWFLINFKIKREHRLKAETVPATVDPYKCFIK